MVAQASAPFTTLKNPLVPDLNTPNGVIGWGPASVVGVSGPFLASQAFSSFAKSGQYPAPGELQQFPFSIMQRKFANPYAEQASLEVESQLGAGWMLTLGYHFTHALDMPLFLSINGLPDGTLPDGRQAFTARRSRFRICDFRRAGCIFDLQRGCGERAQETLPNHYSVLANYTWSKSIDLETDLQLTDTPQDYLDPSLDRSVGDNDIRHRATLSFLATSPDTWRARCAISSFRC